MKTNNPLQGEVWFVDLDPTIGHEQSKKRPCLVLSNNAFNQGCSGLVFIVPITSKNKNNPFHIKINPPEGGLVTPSYIMVDQTKSLSIQRFASQKTGVVSKTTMSAVQYVLTIILELSKN